jgi:hypothetical protein
VRILDIKGKPVPWRNRTKQRLRAQDFRDLLKICIMLIMVIIGYFLFAPTRDAASGVREVTAENK